MDRDRDGADEGEDGLEHYFRSLANDEKERGEQFPTAHFLHVLRCPSVAFECEIEFRSLTTSHDSHDVSPFCNMSYGRVTLGRLIAAFKRLLIY